MIKAVLRYSVVAICIIAAFAAYWNIQSDLQDLREALELRAVVTQDEQRTADDRWQDERRVNDERTRKAVHQIVSMLCIICARTADGCAKECEDAARPFFPKL